MEVGDSQCLIMDTVRRSCCLLALRPPSLQAAAAVEMEMDGGMVDDAC